LQDNSKIDDKIDPRTASERRYVLIYTHS